MDIDFSHIIGHEDVIRHFKTSIEMDRVAHAYIINGEDDCGKYTLAKAFAKTLQCEEHGVDPCNKCVSCIQSESGNHPDIIHLVHEKENTISVGEVRSQLVNSIDIKPYSSKYKIYIINDAQLMNEEAQNAILKSIEEPPAYGVIMLLTNSLDKLLPTIVSRCLTINVHPVKERDIEEHLIKEHGIDQDTAEFCAEYSQGNFGKAVKLATNEEYRSLVNSIVSLMENIPSMDMEEIADRIKESTKYKVNINEYLDIMMMWYRDILMWKVTGKIDKILFKMQFSSIKKQASIYSFNNLEQKAKAIEDAKTRIRANAKLEDIMRLLIMKLQSVK